MLPSTPHMHSKHPTAWTWLPQSHAAARPTHYYRALEEANKKDKELERQEAALKLDGIFLRREHMLWAAEMGAPSPDPDSCPACMGVRRRSVCVCVPACISVCMYVYICMYVCMCSCMYVCIYACVYVCLCACMHPSHEAMHVPRSSSTRRRARGGGWCPLTEAPSRACLAATSSAPRASKHRRACV
jgi:hypothetical protein